MKTKISGIIVIIVLWGFSSLFAQGFQPPADGKAVVYFVCVKKTNAREYFHQDKYIGLLTKGKNYMRFECDPGENLFWASAENKEFVIANLMEGGTYIVIGENKMGMWSSGVRLTPITEDDELFKKARALINEKKPVVTPESKIELRNSELVEFIANIMDHYENEWKDKHDYPHISADMAISANAMK